MKSPRRVFAPILGVFAVLFALFVFTDDAAAQDPMNHLWRYTGFRVNTSQAGTITPEMLGAADNYGYSTDLNVVDSVFDLQESVWRGTEGRVRATPLKSNGEIKWNFGTGWSAPMGTTGLPGGNSAVQSLANYRIGDTLVQSIWQGNQGWTRNVPIVHDVVQWNSAPGWGNPIPLSDLPGAGSLQAHGDYAAGSVLIQAVWRNNLGYTRNVPIVNGVPKWDQRGPWNVDNPIPISTLPGSGDMQAQDNFAIYNTYYQTIWRGGYQHRRTVPIVNNEVRWDLRSNWMEYVTDDTPPGTNAVTAQGNYVIDWRTDINPNYRRGEIRVERANFGFFNNWYGFASSYFVNQNGATYSCYTYPPIFYDLDCPQRRVDSGLIQINTYFTSPPPYNYLARHEMGHIFGRGHPNCNTPISVMYEPVCSNFQTTLTSSDISWINANY